MREKVSIDQEMIDTVQTIASLVGDMDGMCVLPSSLSQIDWVNEFILSKAREGKLRSNLRTFYTELLVIMKEQFKEDNNG